jgi:hypothetical protein
MPVDLSAYLTSLLILVFTLTMTEYPLLYIFVFSSLLSQLSVFLRIYNIH